VAVQSSRIASIDALKALSIAAVVLLHCGAVWRPVEGPAKLVSEIIDQLCRFAVPAFFAVAGYLFARSWAEAHKRRGALRRYLSRLGGAFVFWSAFYIFVPPFIWNTGDSYGPAVAGRLREILRFPHHYVLTGAVYHLWFLSSLAEAVIIVWFGLRFRLLHATTLAAAGLYAVGLLAGPYTKTQVGFDLGFDTKTGPFASTLLVALGAQFAGRRHFSATAGWALVGIGYLLHFTEAVLVQQTTGRPLSDNNFFFGTGLIGIGCLELALAYPTAGARFAGLGIWSLGVYALHPYFIEVLRRVYPSAGLLASLIAAGVIYSVAVLAVMLLAQVRPLRMFVR
jgi:surface polysaccharide O-acyltransferase-like enzyme